MRPPRKFVSMPISKHYKEGGDSAVLKLLQEAGYPFMIDDVALIEQATPCPRTGWYSKEVLEAWLRQNSLKTTK